MDRPYIRLTVNEKAEKLLRGGHPWVYGAEVLDISGSYRNGDLADAVSRKGRWLGTGFINDRSKIMLRLLSRNTNDRFDRAWFKRRLEHAVDLRRQVMGDDFNACRLIFGEADFFPGLTVDRFEDVLVSEVLSCGIDCRRELIYNLLTEVLAERGVTVHHLYERNESPLRDKEGLERGQGFYLQPGLSAGNGHVTIRENGLLFDVDYINGQKTGYFLDQKYNRRAVGALSKGLRVLDCCTHTGAFALNAAFGGARAVTGVDVSAAALQQAAHNASLNGLQDQVQWLQADVFELLSDLCTSKRRDYDLIVLDPPAFTKSGDTVGAAFRGYKEINLKALRLLGRGGYLATCSCSHFMTNDLFRAMLTEAAADAGVSLRQIEERQQGPDHPILWGVPESNYLKFYLLQVV